MRVVRKCIKTKHGFYPFTPWTCIWLPKLQKHRTYAWPPSVNTRPILKFLLIYSASPSDDFVSITNFKQSAAAILQTLATFASMFIDYVIDMLLEAPSLPSWFCAVLEISACPVDLFYVEHEHQFCTELSIPERQHLNSKAPQIDTHAAISGIKH